MKWAIPPKIKIYEALGCMGDKRIEVSENTGKVFSSSRGKYYTVNFDGDNAIMCNNNGSYWIGYLGYPAIAFLMVKEKIRFNNKFADTLKDIPWKDMNVKFKNDYEKTQKYVFEILKKRGVDIAAVEKEIDSIFEQIKQLDLNLFGKKIRPPSGY